MVYLRPQQNLQKNIYKKNGADEMIEMNINGEIKGFHNWHYEHIIIKKLERLKSLMLPYYYIWAVHHFHHALKSQTRGGFWLVILCSTYLHVPSELPSKSLRQTSFSKGTSSPFTMFIKIDRY